MPDIPDMDKVRSMETDSVMDHLGEIGAMTGRSWMSSVTYSALMSEVVDIIVLPGSKLIRPSIFTISGFKYRDSLPRILDNLLRRIFR